MLRLEGLQFIQEAIELSVRDLRAIVNVEDEAADEHPASAEQVGEPAAEQQEPSEGEHVRVHDPGEVVVREGERLADRRQGDVDDRGIEHDDELRHREQRQRDPSPAFELLRGGHLLIASFLTPRPCGIIGSRVPVSVNYTESEFRL